MEERKDIEDLVQKVEAAERDLELSREKYEKEMDEHMRLKAERILAEYAEEFRKNPPTQAEREAVREERKRALEQLRALGYRVNDNPAADINNDDR